MDEGQMRQCVMCLTRLFRPPPRPASHEPCSDLCASDHLLLNSFGFPEKGWLWSKHPTHLFISHWPPPCPAWCSGHLGRCLKSPSWVGGALRAGMASGLPLSTPSTCPGVSHHLQVIYDKTSKNKYLQPQSQKKYLSF